MSVRYRSRVGSQADLEAGFTLIELTIVVVVVAVVTAVAVFGLSGVTSMSAQASCNADARTVEIAQQAYRAHNGVFGTEVQLTATDSQGIRYLRSFPSNPQHYVISTDATGVVTVQANDGNGVQLAVAATNYDGTPNPCNAVK